MPNSLLTPTVSTVLDRLFDAADLDEEVFDELSEDQRARLATANAAERTEIFESVYMPVSREGGALLYALVRALRPATVVEFGTSFGISTAHLAAAVCDNGAGRVISTELSATKVAAARANLSEMGLSEVVTILEGDALETLATVEGPIGLVLLDGWKNLYVPVLHLLEPLLAPGALVLGDDTVSLAEPLADYLSYVRDPANGYVSIAYPMEDGMELSCRT